MLRSFALILSLLLSPPALAQSADDVAANRLFVEAVQLWNRARDEPVAQQAGTLREVQANLQAIIDRHGGASLAVRLVIGETIGPLSLALVQREVRRASDALIQAGQAGAHAANATAGVGRVLRDCPECPEMVVLPAGSTRLSSGRDVIIGAPFAIGKFEVTFEEWDACFAQGGCSHRPDDEGWGRGRQPVMNVSWNDVQSYLWWLSRKTGKPYRLLSEAEWEYAAQAGTGREPRVRPGAGEANCADCGSRWDGKQAAPVGSFAANTFGLYDMLGNVAEWMADCWAESVWNTPSIVSAPTDGSPRQTVVCAGRSTRGGSWYSDQLGIRSAFFVGFLTCSPICPRPIVESVLVLSARSVVHRGGARSLWSSAAPRPDASREHCFA
jgi:formylglycine-generating enzyme required for sulfatase activity